MTRNMTGESLCCQQPSRKTVSQRGPLLPTIRLCTSGNALRSVTDRVTKIDYGRRMTGVDRVAGARPEGATTGGVGAAGGAAGPALAGHWRGKVPGRAGRPHRAPWLPLNAPLTPPLPPPRRPRAALWSGREYIESDRRRGGKCLPADDPNVPGGRDAGPYNELRHHHKERGELMKGIAVGIVLAIVGLVLWLTTKEVETPIVSLHKAGLILAIIGGAEALFALLGLGKKANK